MAWPAWISRRITGCLLAWQDGAAEGRTGAHRRGTGRGGPGGRGGAAGRQRGGAGAAGPDRAGPCGREGQHGRSPPAGGPAGTGWRTRTVPGGPRPVTPDQAGAVIVATLEDAAHWSRRSMAKRSGLSRSAIGQIWRDFGLRPHLADGFRLSTDPQFAEKVVDVVGLCHNPPEKAVVLCVDEKSQIQAYPGDDPGLCDGGQEPDMTGSGSLTDGISGVSPQRSQRPRTDAHGRSACPARAVSPLTEPGTHPGLVLAASVTDASATASPARTYPPA